MKNKELSKERKKYLKKLKIEKISILLTQIFLLIGLLLTWEILANKNIIDSFITSQPSRILDTLLNLTSNDLIRHIYVTAYETVVGFLIGTILGFFVAVVLWWSDFLKKVLEPYLVVLNSLPKVALGPIIILWVGARYFCYNFYGCCNFTCCNNIRSVKWFYKNR